MLWWQYQILSYLFKNIRKFHTAYHQSFSVNCTANSDLWFQLSLFQIQLTSSSCFPRSHGEQLVICNNLWYIGSILSCSLSLPFYFHFLLVGRDFNMSVWIFVVLSLQAIKIILNSSLLKLSDSLSFMSSTLLTSREYHLLPM